MMIQSVDIIIQILYRLPSKSVGRFRCVSKGWLSLLTDPKFIETHQKTLNRNHLLFRDRYDQLYSHPFDHHDPFILKPTKLPIELGDHITFHGSCDGLVLVSYSTYNMGPLMLLNPTTRESVQLPQSAGRYYHHGVGYDSVTDDYKVITITNYRRDRVSVYSLRSNTWRQLTIDYPYECSLFSPPAVYVNGFLHWFGKKEDSGDRSQVIVAFSLADECFSEVPSPNDTEIMSDNNCKFVVLGGKLAIYVNSDSKWSPVKFEVWLMNEYGVKESWTKIPFDIFDDEFGMRNSMIFDDDNGKIRVAGNGYMLIYDFEKRTLSKNVYILSRRFWLFGSYVESLVSPKTKDTADHSEAAKILNDKKASLRKKEREEEEAKPKNKRRKRQRI